MVNRWGNNGNSDIQTLSLGAPKSLQMVITAMKLKDTCSFKESYDQHWQHVKKQRHYFGNKGPSSQSYGFSSSHVWIWGFDHKENWALKNWYFWNVVLEKTLKGPLDCKEIKAVHPKWNQSWIFIGGLMLKLKLQYLGHQMGRTNSLEKTQCWERLKAGGEGDGRGWDGWMASLTRWMWVWASSGSWWCTGSLACCSPWGCKELDMTGWCSWTKDITIALHNKIQ